MQQFKIVLRNDKAKLYVRITLLLIIINLLFFFYAGIIATESATKSPILVNCAVILIVLFIDLFLHRTGQHEGSPYQYFAILTIISTWIQLNYWWIAVIIFLLGVIAFMAQRSLQVLINTQSVEYPSLPNKSFQWTDLSNVILKDGLLTIESKNNRLVQQYIDDKKTNVNEQEFNEFCRQQLN